MAAQAARSLTLHTSAPLSSPCQVTDTASLVYSWPRRCGSMLQVLVGLFVF